MPHLPVMSNAHCATFGPIRLFKSNNSNSIPRKRGNESKMARDHIPTTANIVVHTFGVIRPAWVEYTMTLYLDIKM